MTNYQRAVALRSLYFGALHLIGNSISTYNTSLREAVISKEAICTLKNIFVRVPIMYERFYENLEIEKVEEANEQLDFILKSLDEIISTVNNYKNILKSHNNNTTIAAEDFASLQKLQELAEQQKNELLLEKELLGEMSDAEF